MRPIRLYLLIYSNAAGWEANVYRDLDEMLAIWNDARQKGGRVGFVHVGLSRPPNKAFEAVAASWSERMLLTTSARWVFDTLGTYSSTIAEAGGLGLHLALSGWGYSATLDKDSIDTKYDLGSKFDSPVLGGITGDALGETPWLCNLERFKPTIFAEAVANGVIDEMSYQDREAYLNRDLRRVLGAERLAFLVAGKDENDPIAIAHALPPWLLITPLSDITLTVRCARSLNKEGITKVSDLKGLTLTDLLKCSNFGRKSQADLAKSLRNAVLSGPLSMDEKATSPMLRSDATQEGYALGRCVVEAPNPRATFLSAFESVLQRLKDNQRSILKQRIGLFQDRMTLEEIGEELTLTRERIRQIE